MTVPNAQLLGLLASLPAGTTDADALTAANTATFTARTYRIDYTWMGSIWGGGH